MTDFVKKGPRGRSAGSKTRLKTFSHIACDPPVRPNVHWLGLRTVLGEIESEKGELSVHPLYSTRALGRRELEAGPRRLESMIVSRQSMPSQYRWATCELGS